MKKCISIILTIFMVFSLIIIPTNKVYGQVDVTAPELRTIRIDKSSGTAGEEITFTAEVTDDMSGVSSIGVTLRMPVVNRLTSISLEDKGNGVYEGKYKIKEDDVNGIWVIEWVHLADKQGNEKYVYDNSYLGSGDKMDLSVCNFEVKEDDNPIKQISGITVISSNETLSNKIINGDLYIAPNVAVSEYSYAAEPPVQFRLSHLSRRSEPL